VEEVTTFLQWFADHFSQQRYEQVLADLECSRRGLQCSSIEAAVAGRDAAWRLYALAGICRFAQAADYFYEVYELVCRQLSFALGGTW
jgi:hypothetical protein